MRAMVYTMVTSIMEKKRLMRVRKPNKKKRSPYAGLDRYIKGLEKRYHYFDCALRYWS
jgi:hypothetical protein